MFLIGTRKYKIKISDQTVRDEFCELPRETRRALLHSYKKVKHTNVFRIREKTCLTSRIKTDSGLRTFGVVHKHSVAVIFCIHRSILTILAIRRFLRSARIVVEESFNFKKNVVHLRIAALPDEVVWIVDHINNDKKSYKIPVDPDI